MRNSKENPVEEQEVKAPMVFADIDVPVEVREEIAKKGRRIEENSWPP